MAATVGCGGSTADNLITEQIAILNQMADALEKGDKAKAKELDEKGKDVAKRLDALKLSDEEKAKVMEKHKDALAKAFGRCLEASMKNAMPKP